MRSLQDATIHSQGDDDAMRTRRFVLAIALGGVTCLLASVVTPLLAADYDVPGGRSLREAVPKEMASGPNYRITDPVRADGYMYRFNVNSTYGTWDVTGIGALRKLLDEIRAITALRDIKKSKAWATAVAESATGPFRLGRDLILHPVDTLSGVPRGTYKFMEDAAVAVTTERDPSDDPAYKKALLMSGRKREYAAQLGVDPYSSNAVLQKELNSVAWAAAAGNLTVSAALMPVGGAAGAALTGVRWSTAVNDYLKAQPPPRLRILNEEKLTGAGVSPELVKRFLDHPNFTPRHDTIIAESLSRLGNAQGRDRFLDRACGADDEVDVNFFVNAAQVLRGYHETVAPITDIQLVGGRLIVAQSAKGNALVPLPIDYGMWTPATERRIEELRTTYRGAGFSGNFDVWLTGTVSPQTRQALTARGMTVAEEVRKRVEIID